MIVVYLVGVTLAFDTFTSSEPAGILPLEVTRKIRIEIYIY